MELINTCEIPIGLIQEPWTVKNKVSGIHHFNYQLFYENYVFFSPRVVNVGRSTAAEEWQHTPSVSLLPFNPSTLLPKSEQQRLVNKAKQKGNEVLIVAMLFLTTLRGEVLTLKKWPGPFRLSKY